MRILLVGGGTGGPAAPLLAVAEEIKKLHPRAEFLLVGTKSGPEKFMAENAGIPFKSISSGKLRRYFSLKNIASPLFIAAGFFQSISILKKFKPSVVLGTGSFVQVPLVWAAWFLKIPVVLHQQDVLPSLANKLCQFCAKKITVTFEESLAGFSSSLGVFYKKKEPEKIIFTGNPFRYELKKPGREHSNKVFGLREHFPTLLVLGGGTGAQFLNTLIEKAAPEITKFAQIIHSTGKNRGGGAKHKDYHPYEFIPNMGEAYAAADIVLARAGLSTITELSNLKKASIIVPMPKTHQELNAFLLMERESAVVFSQDKLTPKNFTTFLRKFLFQHEVQESLKVNISKIMPHNAAEKIAEIVEKAAN